LSAKYLDLEPKSIEVDDETGIKRITDIVRKRGSQFPAIIIDDFSLICDAELTACKKASQGWGAFDIFNKRVYQLRDVARNAPCHVFLTMHEQPPREVKKPGQTRWIPGAPLIPGWQLPEKLPAMCDFVARVVYDETSPGWPYVYQAGPDPEYITGDRLAIMPDKFPLNLREVMLASGISVPRPEELKWMDEKVEALSSILVAELKAKQPDIKRHLREAASTMLKKPQRHVRWVLADALDRAQLKKHQASLLDSFIQAL
jgi:hypothetical protein